MKGLNLILSYLPETIKNEIKMIIEKHESYAEEIEEIRIRTEKPIVLKIGQATKILKHKVSQEEILQTFEKICENSVYSYQKQICEGFITIKEGHRIGITGNVVMEGGKIINIRYVSSLNFRIAREKINCSIPVLKYVIDIENDHIYHTLLASPPGAGKTTMLRDTIRKISNGIQDIGFKGKTCGIVDERGEIAAMYKGIPQNDIGIRTDVVDNISKAEGMRMLIRSMSPQIICCDEIGTREDVEAINYAACSGVKGIFTAHGGAIEELNLNPMMAEILKKHIFERIIFLNPNKKGEILKVYALDKKNKEYLEI